MAMWKKRVCSRLCRAAVSIRRCWTAMVICLLVVAAVELGYSWTTTAPNVAHVSSSSISLYVHVQQGRQADGLQAAAPGVSGPVGKEGDSQGGTSKSPLSSLQIRKHEGKPHDKWVVLDVTSGDCLEPVVTAPPGWRVIVVGELSNSSACKAPACIMWDQETSTAQGQSGEGQLLRRRNLAYLTAISGGALQIVDAECRGDYAQAVRDLGFNSTLAFGLLYNETRQMNVYQHFGLWDAMPRALAASPRSGERTSRLYYVRDFSTVYVKHRVSEMAEDIVWMHGTRRRSSRFDHSVPPVYVGQRAFSPALSACTAYHQRAFWALLLPGVSRRLPTQILRQYVTQRMLRELDAFSAFHLQKHRADGRQPDRTRSSSQSLSVGLDVDKLAKLLDAWVCEPRLTFYQCLGRLADKLQLWGFLGDVERTLVQSWLASLRELGVSEPSRVLSPWRGVRKITEVPIFLGNVGAFLREDGSAAEKSLEKVFVDPLRKQCNMMKSDWFATIAQWRRPVIRDIVLIVVFNENKYFSNNLPYLETTHRPFFKHIVYCVPNVTQAIELTGSEKLGHVTVIEGLSDEWYLLYECLENVARMDIQGVRGYLQIGDDSLLNTWILANASRDTIWLPRGFTTVDVDRTKHPWGWYHWTKARGRPAILHTLSDLERLSGMTSDEILRLNPGRKKVRSSNSTKTFSDIYREDRSSFPRLRTLPAGSQYWPDPSKDQAADFLSSYIRNNRLLGKVAHRALDFIYIPHVLREQFVTFSRYFRKHGVIIELAVPAMHHGLMRRADVNYVRASSLWDSNRNSTWAAYDKTLFFLHPFKMLGHMKTAEGREFFCAYLKTLFVSLPSIMNSKT